MMFFITHIKKLSLFTLAVTVMLISISCQSSSKIMEQESQTGIYEIRSSGLFNKSYTFSNYTINKISTSGKPTKSVLRHEGAKKTISNKAMSFEMEDTNGFKWSGLGGVEAESVALGKNKPQSNTLIYSFRITETQTNRVIRYEISYKPISEGFDGFMRGTVVDEAGIKLYDVYSSKNLNYTTNPSEGINGFSIRKDDKVLSTIIKTQGNWSITFNVAEDDPERVEMSAVLSSIYVLIEEGRI